MPRFTVLLPNHCIICLESDMNADDAPVASPLRPGAPAALLSVLPGARSLSPGHSSRHHLVDNCASQQQLLGQEL
jgi:hypothetical protein